MANATVTFTITGFCLCTGVSEEELHEIIGLGAIEPHEDETFDDHALTVMRRAVRLRQELELDWPGIAAALTLLEGDAQLRQENRLLCQRLSRFISHPQYVGTSIVLVLLLSAPHSQ